MPKDAQEFEQKVSKLVDILCDLDEFDTPKVKLPDCPKCGEDELGVIHADWLLCYRCGWEITGRQEVETAALWQDDGEAGA